MTPNILNTAVYQSTTLTLSLILTREKIPHTVEKLHGGYQFRFPWCRGDMVCHSYSYGSKWGSLESYNFPWDEDDVSVFSVDEAAEKIIEHYYKLKKEEEGEE